MTKLRLLLGAAVLLLTAGLLSAAHAPAAGEAPDLGGFQAVTPASGWVLLGGQLYWTSDSGARWAKITPALAKPSDIRAGWFASDQQGWLVTTSGAPGADPLYELLTTGDGGHTWHSAPLELFAPGDTAALAAEVMVNFRDASNGWLVVKQATSSAFDLRTVFHTSDGGLTWGRRPEGDLPPDVAAGGDMTMATAEAGWSLTATGSCKEQDCTLEVALRQTNDGGQTWQPLLLPGGRAMLVSELPAPADVGAAASLAAYAFTYTGPAFDGCFVDSGPTPLTNMQAWMNASPYHARNLYIGGSAGAPCTPLTKNYVQQLAQQGWVFVPTWVGPQSPCYSGAKRKMSGDVTQAYQQGIIEAHLALDRAAALGLARPDGSGTVLYYDVESYNHIDPAVRDACRESVKALISGWSGAVRAAGSLAGVYGSPCSSYLEDLAGVANVPDAVWIAFWQGGGYDPGASVMGIPCIDDSLWTSGQRLRQYAGGHNEEWGGVTLNIDSNVLGGPAATVAGNCQPGAQQIAVFIFPNFGGQCVVKNTGVYSTVESLGLPNDTISSIRVGAGTQVQVCEHVALGGVCTNLAASAAELSAQPIGDNHISSFHVQTATQALPNHYYLPLVGQIAQVVSLVPNGGFEAGNVLWSLASTNGRSLIVTQGELGATGNTTHSGGWASWLGGVFSETASLSQNLLVPPEGPYLAYWQWVDSNESGCHYDIVSIWVNEAVVDAYGLCASLETNAWTRRAVDLSAYAGQTVSLRLQLVTDGSSHSSLYLDDFAFESGP